MIKKIVASVVGVSESSVINLDNIDAPNTSYILALNPLSKNFNNTGRIIIIMIFAILILVGYTLFNNKNN